MTDFALVSKFGVVDALWDIDTESNKKFFLYVSIAVALYYSLSRRALL